MKIENTEINAEINTEINEVMIRLNKPASPTLGVFVTPSKKTGKLRITTTGIDTKGFKQSFKNHQKFFVGTYNSDISTNELRDDINFVVDRL